MADLIKEAISLSEHLKTIPLLKEYLKVKKEFERDSYLNSIRNSLCSLAKDKKQNKDEINRLTKEMESHPLFINFQTLKEETFNFLNEVMISLKN